MCFKDFIKKFINLGQETSFLSFLHNVIKTIKERNKGYYYGLLFCIKILLCVIEKSVYIIEGVAVNPTAEPPNS